MANLITPKQGQAKIIREIYKRGGSCDQRDYPIHPVTAGQLDRKGFIQRVKDIVGPRGGRYWRYTLTKQALEWVAKYPNEDDNFIRHFEGHIIDGVLYPPDCSFEIKQSVYWSTYRGRGIWKKDHWVVDMIGTTDEFTKQEINEISIMLTVHLDTIKTGPVNSWDWSRVRVVSDPQQLKRPSLGPHNLSQKGCYNYYDRINHPVYGEGVILFAKDKGGDGDQELVVKFAGETGISMFYSIQGHPMKLVSRWTRK